MGNLTILELSNRQAHEGMRGRPLSRNLHQLLHFSFLGSVVGGERKGFAG